MLRKIRNRQQRLEFSESSAALFNSSLGLDQLGGSNRNNPGALRRQESVIRKRNIQIIEQLLSEFDMDETVEKYSSQSIVEFKLDPNKCSYDTTASTIRLRDRLQSLMGSDVIRLNDRKYTEELRRKLEEEYEAKLRKKEDALAKAEKNRIRKLMLEGVIPMDSKEEDPLIPNSRQPKRKHRSHQKRSESARQNNTQQSSQSGSPSRIPRYSSASPGSTERSSQLVKTQIETEPETPGKRDPTLGASPKMGASANEKEQFSERKSFKTENEKANQESTPKNKENVDTDTRNDSVSDNDSLRSGNSSSSSRKRKSKLSAKENPLVQTLREEETVAGLYHIAARLVAPPVR